MTDYMFLDQEAVDLLSATIVRRAYEDLLEALLLDVAVRQRKSSFNCAMYYKRMKAAKTPKYPGSSVAYQNGGNTPEDKRDAALREIKKLTKWFTESERCRVLLKHAKGEWFVEQARIKANEFAHDRIMLTETHIVLNRIDGQTERTRQRQLKKWRKERDAWRKEHGLSEVVDAE